MRHLHDLALDTVLPFSLPRPLEHWKCSHRGYARRLEHESARVGERHHVLLCHVCALRTAGVIVGEEDEAESLAAAVHVS